jgi:GNAT superfamily N-acetyltransferase
VSDADAAEFRPARRDELDALVAMMAELAAEPDPRPFDADQARLATAQLMDDPARGDVRAICVEGELAGYLVLTFGYSLEYGGIDAFVDELYLAPAWRGRGIGRRALDVAAQLCRERGVRAVHLEVDRGNPRARTIYRDAGFGDRDRFLMTRWLVPAPEEPAAGDPAQQPLVRHRGGCHCGRVRFEVEAPARPNVRRCTCSRCRLSGFVHLIVPASRFHLLQGQDALATYTFNTHTAKHLFCRVCGIQSFYVPRSNPDGYDVDVRCIEPGTMTPVEVEPFDGANWEAHAASLAHLSRDR